MRRQGPGGQFQDVERLSQSEDKIHSERDLNMRKQKGSMFYSKKVTHIKTVYFDTVIVFEM